MQLRLGRGDRKRAFILTSLITVCGAATSADASEAPTGARRVRVTAPAFAGKPLTGSLVALEEATLKLLREGSSEVVEIPRRDVTRFEVITRTSRRGRAAGIGALVGLGVGAALGYAAGDDCGAPDAPSFVCIPRPASAGGVGLLGAALGALIGVAVGPGEKWEVRDPGRVRLTVSPSPQRSGGVGLALSIGF
jgi:hypothetical protein